MDPLQPPSGVASVFRGALLTVGMRWTDRLIGLVSIFILARLLVPEDFGLVAMAAVVMGLLDVFLDLGVSAALIQKSGADRADFDTAWTLRLCQASVVATLIIVTAPFAATYYGDPRVVDVLRVMAVTTVVGGLENIGIVTFQKNLEFGRDFRFFFFKRLLGTAVTIGAALILESYWALVLGSLATRSFGVGLSYLMHSFRPRLSLARMRSIWSFSQWMIVNNVGGYLSSRLDKLLVGRRAGAEVTGAYALADELASMPTTELLAPLGRVLFPAFAKAKDDRHELVRILCIAIGVQALVGVPAGIGVALVAQEMVSVVLGDAWQAAVPFVQLLGILGVAGAIGASSHYVLLAVGQVRTLSVYYWSQLTLFALLMFWAFPEAGAYGIAVVRVLVGYVGIVTLQVLVRTAVPELTLRATLEQLWRPIVATAVMAAAVLAIPSEVSAIAPGIGLAVKIAVGSISYSLTVVALWFAVGRPAGGESYFLDKFSSIGVLGRFSGASKIT